MWLYAYSTHITLHGGPEKWQKRGRAKRVLSRFCRHGKGNFGDLRKVAPLSLIGFGSFSLLIPPCLFTVHVRLVLSPCQAGNTCYIFTCVSNLYTIDNIINMKYTHKVYNIMCSTAIYVRDHRILLDLYIIS